MSNQCVCHNCDKLVKAELIDMKMICNNCNHTIYFLSDKQYEEFKKIGIIKDEMP